VFLADHELVQKMVYFLGLGQVFVIPRAAFLELFANDVVAQLDTFVTNINTGASDQLSNFMLTLATE
jgi:hypothetical protein